ncbi:hypothetical protein OBBRIDRAFT_280645 [Obba rivulosa]|uniref:DUF6533 domain-containing protein n=1 Tax=Obba rivulosa TaxID=1052685 RepID=A0A8E2AP88_9APHY|nr:hypothetical protein OBBRIDRAFT_280645 [Obba rivulosa]
MSLQYGPEAVVMLEVINILDSTWIQKCCVIAAFGLVLCDHTSTLIREVELIWGRRLTSVTILFYLNRWIIVACAGLNYLGNIFDLILLTIWSAFSGIRIYAVTQGSLPLAMTVSLLNMVPVGTNAVIHCIALLR